MTAERNILGKQLIRRNEELSLIYEKIKIQERALIHWIDGFLHHCVFILLFTCRVKRIVFPCWVSNSKAIEHMMRHLKPDLLERRTTGPSMERCLASARLERLVLDRT